MPPKLPKRPKRPESPRAESAADTAAPSLSRTAANAYLYNQDLFGLNPRLDFRTRLIISCYVFDNIQPSVIRAAFAKAHIYPPSTVKELARGVSCRSGGMAARESSRLLKDNAARELETLGRQASLMSSGDVICKAHEIVSNVLNSDQYAMRPLEELTCSRRKKKDHVKDAGSAMHKKVVGLFTPADSQAIADSFSEEDAFHNATHLFVCPEDGCSRRFSSHAWLASHLKKVHRITMNALSPAEETHRAHLMELQKQAKLARAAGGAVPTASIVADVAIPTDDDADVAIPTDDDDDMYECQFEDEGLSCGARTKTDPEMWQHYSCAHPNRLNNGISCRYLRTGEEFGPMDVDYNPLNDDAAAFVQLVMDGNLDMCNWEAVKCILTWLQNWVDQNGQIADVQALVGEFLDDAAADAPRYFHRAPSPYSSPPQSPLPRATQCKPKVRKCGNCGEAGHQKNSKKCRWNKDDFSLESTESPKALRSPRSPRRTPPTASKYALASP